MIFEMLMIINGLNGVWSDVNIQQIITQQLGFKNFPSKLEIFTKLKKRELS